MYLLGLDTSTEYAIGIVGDENGQLCGKFVEWHERSLSVRLYPAIEALLASVGIGLEQIGAFAVGIGPGSFTGVRVAVTTLRTLAQVTGKPLVAVGTLDAIARTAAGRQKEIGDGVLCALLPSRRNEVYAAVYRDGALQAGPMTASYSEARNLGGDDALFAGPGALLGAVFPDQAANPHGPFRLTAVEFPGPAELAAIAADELHTGSFRDPLALDPMYVAPAAISQHKKGVTGP